MTHKLIDEFCWFDESEQPAALSAAEKYKRITDWALKARGRNPNAFDALTEWVLDDAQWNEEKLAENEQILTKGVFARFKEQNARLLAILKELELSGVVNAAVFKELDRFDGELSGQTRTDKLCEAATRMNADFSAMLERGVRERIAGKKTGPHGTTGVDLFGYINSLKDCDAGVQWTLFMPDMVKNQLKGTGVALESFEYITLPAFRYIGVEADFDRREEIMRVLDDMPEYASGFGYDLLLQHHYGRGVDAERWHGFLGRFMKANAPVPEGFAHFDFLSPDEQGWSGAAGVPYLRQFAFAVFSAESDDALHKAEGFDSDVMYDVTRNIILGEGVSIPYPEKYWTAEAQFDRYDGALIPFESKNGAGKTIGGYLFSVDLH